MSGRTFSRSEVVAMITTSLRPSTSLTASGRLLWKRIADALISATNLL
ncbi:MAG: hypothetical protein QXG25_01415 [Nitrososphaerota archaeon]